MILYTFKLNIHSHIIVLVAYGNYILSSILSMNIINRKAYLSTKRILPK